MNTLANTTLHTCLLEFQRLFNTHSRVKKLIKNWERVIFIEATDKKEEYAMVVSNLQVERIAEGIVRDDAVLHHTILLQAEADVLVQIFSGDYNPATAHIDGALAVFSPDKDKVKLEAIAMVIWGLS